MERVQPSTSNVASGPIQFQEEEPYYDDRTPSEVANLVWTEPSVSFAVPVSRNGLHATPAQALEPLLFQETIPVVTMQMPVHPSSAPVVVGETQPAESVLIRGSTPVRAVQNYVVARSFASPRTGSQALPCVVAGQSQVRRALTFGGHALGSGRHPVGLIPTRRAVAGHRQPQPSFGNSNAHEGTAETSTTSNRNRKGRPTSWWKTECFSEYADAMGNGLFRCKLCGVEKTGGNASRLAQHIWAECPQAPNSIKDRLLADSTYIRNKVKEANPSKRRRSSSYRDGQVDDAVQGDIVGRMNGSKRCRNNSPPPRITECSEEDSKRISILLLRCVIDLGLAFTIFDSSRCNPNQFRRTLKEIRPGYDSFFPTRSSAIQVLKELYRDTKMVVSKSLKMLLGNGYGTIVFDGWDGVTMSSVVNVMVRVDVGSVRKTFFLSSVYTGHTTMNAGEYVRTVERVMGEYGGMNRICGITSDSARACVNARREITEKYNGIMGLQDQAHVADLLMKDIGKLDFVRHVIDSVNMIVTETRSRRKLLSFLRGKVNDFNSRIREQRKMSRARRQQSRQEEIDETAQGMEEGSSNTQVFPAPGQAQRRNSAPGRIGNLYVETQSSNSPLHLGNLFPELPKTAVMLRRPATTRFASISDMLEAYLRTREVLATVILDPCFEQTLFTSERCENLLKRERYKSFVLSASFLAKVKALHNIFQLCRRYLREFDKDKETSVSDVLLLTDWLDKSLMVLPRCSFLTDEKVLQIRRAFWRRRDGPISRQRGGVQVRLIEDIHVAACLLHPDKAPEDFLGFHDRFREFVQSFVSRVIPNRVQRVAENDDSLFPSPDRSEVVNEMLNYYEDLHSKWMLQRSVSRSEENRPVSMCNNSSLRYWNIQERKSDSCKFLCTLALRTLSISPSSSMVERSFSMQGQIRTKVRNRLSSNLVQMIMFTKWNLKYYDEWNDTWDADRSNQVGHPSSMEICALQGGSDDDGEESWDDLESGNVVEASMLNLGEESDEECHGISAGIS